MNHTRQITKMNLLKVCAKLESLAPDGVLRFRPNPQLNLIALDTRNDGSMKALPPFTFTEEVVVKTYEPCTYGMTVGVIQCVSKEAFEEALMLAVRATASVKLFQHLGETEIVMPIFEEAATMEFVIGRYTMFLLAE